MCENKIYFDSVEVEEDSYGNYYLIAIDSHNKKKYFLDGDMVTTIKTIFTSAYDRYYELTIIQRKGGNLTHRENFKDQVSAEKERKEISKKFHRADMMQNSILEPTSIYNR